MDSEIIFFIIFVVFSILSSLLNRKKKKPNLPPYAEEERSNEAPRRKKPFSFEDILKEFEAEAMGRPLQPEPEKEVVVGQAKEDEYQRQTYSQVQERNSVYESYEGTSYETLDAELEKVAERNERFARDDDYEIKKAQLNDYANTLQDPEGIRKAFIMKEILDRKYF